MRLERGFLVSFYLTMVLACATIACAELPVIPEVEAFAWPMAALFVLAYFLEGRWALTNRSANCLAGVIMAGAGLWVGQFLGSLGPAGPTGTQLVFQLLPHLGLLLAVLILAKSFRPKQARDYWGLHLVGFMTVALACSLEADLLLGVLLAGYLLAGTWNLSLLYLLRDPPQPQAASGKPQTPPIPWRFFGLGLALRRVLAVGALGLLLFVATPRVVPIVGEEGLVPAPQLQTGVGALMDLNRTGRIRMSGEVMFEVEAEDAAGQAKTDLDPEQCWRAMVLDQYQRGKWYHALPKDLPAAANVDAELPDLGPDQFYLRYRFNSRLGRIAVLAEPVAVPRPGQSEPVVFFTLRYEGDQGLARAGVRYPDGELHPPSGLRGFYSLSYRQVTVPPSVPGLSPPVQVRPEETELLQSLPDMPGLEHWTRSLLQRLVERGKLPPEALQRLPGGSIWPEHHEEVALACERYLAHSGEYSYSLRLNRHDRSADPILDFLFNLKEGHCERFASALVVILRTQGIPARVVLGYRGVDNLGGGRYFVRNSHAHSWVEVLVHRPGPGRAQLHWLTLDPTPGDEVSGEALTAWGRWWRNVRVGGGTLWQNYVLDFGREQQEALVQLFDPRRWHARVQELRAEPARALPYLAAASAFLGGIILLRYRRRLGRAAVPADAEVAFYERWLKLLWRRCRLAPLPAQTPREFARQVGNHLEATATTRAVARVPAAIAEFYYRVRYARLPLSEAEYADLDLQISAVDQAMDASRLSTAK